MNDATRPEASRPLRSDLDAIVDDPSLSAGARLAVTRERMKLAMVLPHRARGDTSDASSDGASLMTRLRSIPGAMLLMETVENWWMRHPMRTAVLVAAEASRAIVRPVAQRTPVKLMLIALGVGAVIAWTRPWRWLIRPALFAGLLPQLVSRIVANLPVDSWMAMLGSLSDPARPGSRRSTPATPMPPTTPRRP